MPFAALERHPATPCTAVRGIHATMTRNADGSLDVTYRIEGDLDRVRVPPPRPPRAGERLWQHTCCELFIADAAGPGYQEFNFSPSGEWAAFRFTGYREGASFAAPDPRIGVARSAAALDLTAKIEPGRNGKLRIGLSAVIEEVDGALSYWALRHAPGKPDFHHRDAFALELDEVRH
jgi:hypothetical protein